MEVTVHLAALLLAGQSGAGPSIEYNQGVFTIRAGNQVHRVVASEPPAEPKKSVLFRRGEKYVVWDLDRGLTIRVGDQVYNSRLPDISRTPKLFEREEILETIDLVKRGVRRIEANALSGAKRLGNVVYLLPRWEDDKGRPWLEALVAVDFADDVPRPKLLGKFSGLSLATDPIEDRLFLVANQPAAIVSSEDGWGIGKYDPELQEFSMFHVGFGLRETTPLSARLFVFQEATPYRTNLVGRVDVLTGARRPLFETRGAVELLDTQTPLVAVIRDRNEVRLRNVETGSEVRIQSNSGVKRSPLGVLVYWPRALPTAAVLYDPSSWAQLSRMGR